MLYTSKQAYTPPLHAHEFNEHALIIDTETVGAGPQIEIVEVALGDTRGEIIFSTLVKPLYNRLPPSSKHQRFERGEFERAPTWPEVWPHLCGLIDGKLLVAYNASFDRRALAATLARFAQSSPERGWRCVLQLVRQAMGVRKTPTLADACAHFGVEGGNHRAERDVRATYRLLRSLLPFEDEAASRSDGDGGRGLA
jgi:DNA polymerase-3 subunit epsilon